jgi:hypothetical protein
MKKHTSANATYLYCLVQSKAQPSMKVVPPGLPGMKPPRLIDAGRSLWLVAADAPLSLYGTEPIEAVLQNLHWVSERAMAHERVIEFLSKSGTVIPMKLFTLFTSDQRALSDIASMRKKLDAAVKRVAGRKEWGVRITLNQTRAAAVARQGSNALSRPASGTQFLLLKKKQKDVTLQIRQDALSAGESAYRELAAKAQEARRIPTVPDPASSRVVMDAAFLVPSSKDKSFQQAVQKLTKRMGRVYDVTLTGPWPPYNFVVSVQ